MAKSANTTAAVKAFVNPLSVNVDGEHFDDLDYQDHRQKCPYILSEMVYSLSLEGIGFKVSHDTDQNAEYVDVVEAFGYVDDIDAAYDALRGAYRHRADIHVTLVNECEIHVTGDGRDFRLLQWTESSDITLDDVILCISMED